MSPQQQKKQPAPVEQKSQTGAEQHQDSQIPENSRGLSKPKIEMTMQAIETHESWSGPLPSPTVIAQFDEVLPGAAERIFAQFEAQGNHRRKLETTALNFQARDLLVGKIFAFLFVMGVLGVAVVAVMLGYNIGGLLLASAAIASVVWAFTQRDA